MSQAAEARRPAAGVPVSLIDPFSIDFLRNPHPALETLREAGPRLAGNPRRRALPRHRKCWRSGDVLFRTPRRWPQRFRARSAITVPRASSSSATREHDRARAVLNRALSATVMRSLRARFVEAAEALAADLRPQRPFRRDRRLRRLPDDGAAGRGRLVERGPRASVVLCGDRVQHVRPRQRAAPRCAGADGAACRMDRPAVQTRNARERQHRCDDPRRGEGEVIQQEAELLVRSLLSAGFDTTVHGISAAMRSLAHNPEQFASLRADPSKARAASRRRPGNARADVLFARRRATSSSGERRSPKARKC